jgi:hypothetical protein
MLQAHSKGNGNHKPRLNGEDGPHASALLDQPQLADEIHRLTTALRSGNFHERARRGWLRAGRTRAAGGPQSRHSIP